MTPALFARTSIAAGGTCGGSPCWKAAGGRGLKSTNKAGNADGITQIKVKTSSGSASVQVKGKGANLTLPFPITDSSEMSVQLVKDAASGSECRGATFLSPARENRADQFLDRTP